MIDFQDFKREYINVNLPKLYAGGMDADIPQIVWNMNSDECEEFKVAAKLLMDSGDGSAVKVLLEKLAIEYLSSEAETEYKNMIAAAEDEAGAERAFYNLHR
ncbi:MAG: hypothetical protein ACRCXB_31370 [Aeromonadaceae bacterium]